jgi:F0F1-type ATP synthase beta subunit
VTRGRQNRNKNPQSIWETIIGIEELSQQERVIYERGQRLQNFLTQPFFTAEIYTGRKGAYVPLEEAVAPAPLEGF